MPMIWSCMPPNIRRDVRPVAAADYWLKNKLRAFVGPEVFNCVLVDRRPEARNENHDPMQNILDALDDGSSLIIFPEGNRNMTEDPLLPFKSGLFNMGKARPDVDLVPTWIANVTEIMPKGEVIPLTTDLHGDVHVEDDETKDAFLERASGALVDLAPSQEDRARGGEDNPVVETFKTRVRSWWGMVILFTLALIAGKVGIIVLFAFASFAALREFLTLTNKRQADHLALALGFFVVLPLQYLFVGLDWQALYTVFIPVYAFLMLPVVSASTAF
ncbi:hypothetical protein GQR58_030364 [Nymphon striatum]|nr:hypothetical protein GQR58_030364 [Nymphon striatum]